MELRVADVADMAGRTERAVQLAVQSGALPVLRQVGRSFVIDDVAALAWLRSQAAGRVFSPRLRAAAMALLNGDRAGGLSASELSRLRRRLRESSAAQFAHAVGGVGGAWGRYRRTAPGDLVGATEVELIAEGIVGTPSRRLFQVGDLRDFELRSPIVLDADGDLCVVERQEPVTIARRWLDTYLVGDARSSHIAAESLGERLGHVGS